MDKLNKKYYIIIAILLVVIADIICINLYDVEISAFSVSVATVIYLLVVIISSSFIDIHNGLMVVSLSILSNLAIIRYNIPFNKWDNHLISIVSFQTVFILSMLLLRLTNMRLSSELAVMKTEFDKKNLEALNNHNNLIEFKKQIARSKTDSSMEGMNYYTKIIKISKLAKDLSSTFNIDEIIDIILNSTASFLNASGSLLFIPSPGTNVFKCMNHANINIDEVNYSPENLTIKTDGSIGWAIENKTIITKRAALRDERLKELLRNDSFRFEIAAPLLYQNIVTGILIIVKMTEKPENEEEWQNMLGFTNIIANLAAISLENAVNFKEVHALASTDGLTKLYNHRLFQELLLNNIKESKRKGKNLSLILGDIDYFKKFNDNYGHQMGDKVLKDVAALIKDSIRPSDFAARYGGEEFAIVLPDTDAVSALEVANRFRNKLLEKNFSDNPSEKISVTMSMGISVYPTDSDITTGLIKCSDSSLYKAKRGGRDRIVVFSRDDESERTPL